MSNNNTTDSYGIGSFLYLIVCVLTSLIGNEIHGSIFWSIMDFIFTPLTWFYWLLTKQVNLSIIQEALSWFLN